MTKYRFADLPRWVTKVKKIQDAVVSQATSDMLSDIKVVPGIARGGSRQQGTIPRDLGTLAASLTSTLYGSSAMSQTGAASYVLVAGAMEGGDVAQFTWGGPAAGYAARVHYGFTGTDSLGRTYNQPGTFWVDVAAAGWQGYVARAVTKAKAAIQ